MPDNFNLEEFLPYRLSLLSNRISTIIAASYQRSHDISIPEWRIIAILGQYPASTATQLQDYTAMDKVTISRTVKRLLEKGLISSTNDQHDGRARRLNLSTAGKNLRTEVVPMAQTCGQELTAILTRRELSQFSHIIDKLLAVKAT